MEIIDNVNKTLKEDLTTEIHKGSKVSIAAACFSIYVLIIESLSFDWFMEKVEKKMMNNE